jgi:hypothetical protein
MPLPVAILKYSINTYERSIDLHHINSSIITCLAKKHLISPIKSRKRNKITVTQSKSLFDGIYHSKPEESKQLSISSFKRNSTFDKTYQVGVNTLIKNENTKVRRKSEIKYSGTYNKLSIEQLECYHKACTNTKSSTPFISYLSHSIINSEDKSNDYSSLIRPIKSRFNHVYNRLLHYSKNQ